MLYEVITHGVDEEPAAAGEPRRRDEHDRDPQQRQTQIRTGDADAMTDASDTPTPETPKKPRLSRRESYNFV